MKIEPASQREMGKPTDKPQYAWFMTNRRRWEPKKYSIATWCGELKAPFGTGLVCAAVQHGKTMH